MSNFTDVVSLFWGKGGSRFLFCFVFKFMLCCVWKWQHCLHVLEGKLLTFAKAQYFIWLGTFKIVEI